MAAPARPRAGAGAVAALIVANLALAFGPWFVRMADTGPVSSAFWRIALAAPVLALAALAGGARPRRLDARLWTVLVVAGVCFAGDLGAWHIGILHTTLANATLFGNSATFIYPIYGFLIVRAWPSRLQALALVLAAAGAMLLMGRSYQLDPRNLVGDLFCLLAGILYTAYFVLMARARDSLAPLSALAMSTLFSVVPLLLFALAMGERILPATWTPLIALALCSQVLGQGLMVYVLGKFTPLVIGIALLMQPVMAGVIGWIAYGERLGLVDLVGAGMVGIALVMVTRAAPVAPRDAGAILGTGDER
ncbi:permease [Sphingomonas sp. Leaf17]|nr:permease [Sphingomonas sp. Leaf17]